MKHVMSYVRFKVVFLFGLFSVFVVLGGLLVTMGGCGKKEGSKSEGSTCSSVARLDVGTPCTTCSGKPGTVKRSTFFLMAGLKVCCENRDPALPSYFGGSCQEIYEERCRMITVANVRKAAFCVPLSVLVFLGGGGCGDGGGSSGGGSFFGGGSCQSSSTFSFLRTNSSGTRLCTETRRTAGGDGLCQVSIRRDVPCPSSCTATSSGQFC